MWNKKIRSYLIKRFRNYSLTLRKLITTINCTWEFVEHVRVGGLENYGKFEFNVSKSRWIFRGSLISIRVAQGKMSNKK